MLNWPRRTTLANDVAAARRCGKNRHFSTCIDKVVALAQGVVNSVPTWCYISSVLLICSYREKFIGRKGRRKCSTNVMVWRGVYYHAVIDIHFCEAGLKMNSNVYQTVLEEVAELLNDAGRKSCVQ